jgi:hypothetical protein
MLDLLNKPYLKVLFALILLFIAYNFVMQGVWESFSRIGIDFDAYYHWEKYIGVYPPFWWIFMAPWRLVSYPIAKNLWVSFNLILLFLLSWFSLQWIKKQLQLDNSLLFWLIGVISITIYYFYPLIVTLQTGQVNLLLLFLLGLSYWFYAKDNKTIAAIVLGITISLKPLPGLVLIYWLLKKEYRVAGISLITMVALWLIAIPIFGYQNQIEYFRATNQFTQSLYTNPQQLNNTSFYAFWTETGSLILQNIFIGKILYYLTIISLGILWVITIIRNRQVTPLEYAWTVATPPILIYYTEMHHFILSLLLYLVAIGIWFRIKNPIAKVGLVISWILVNLGFQLGDVTTLTQSSYLYRYLSLFGILIGWIAGLIILNQKKSAQL